MLYIELNSFKVNKRDTVPFIISFEQVWQNV